VAYLESIVKPLSYFDKQRRLQREVIGLLPAGGKATRLSPLPCSKELFPIGFHPMGQDKSLRPKVVCHYLLEKMRLAGISKSYIILRKGKWDIPSYLSDGKALDMHLAYLMLDLPFGVPYTLDQAYPFIQNATVAFGFPDIIFGSEDAFVQLLNRQAESNADVVLGLFPTEHPQKWDMVDLDEDGQIRRIVIKSSLIRLRYAWIIAVWTPIFTNFMHKYISKLKKIMDQNGDQNHIAGKRELYIGDIIQAAIQHDMQIDSVLFSDSFCLDIGTPEDLIEAVSIIKKNSEGYS
jgi:glucose-1-phosphate thymidylyltransferase